MPSNKPNSNSSLPDRLYGEHYPDSFLDVSGSVRKSSVATLGDYIQQLQKVNRQPNQSDVPNQSCKYCFGIGYDASGQRCSCVDNPNFQHPCPNNPILTCNCGDPNDCVELGNDPDNQHVDGNKSCPDSARACNERTCPGECKGDTEGQPIPTAPQRKGAVSSRPRFVLGAICEAWINSSERVSGSEHSSRDTKCDSDARCDDAGSTKTNGL